MIPTERSCLGDPVFFLGYLTIMSITSFPLQWPHVEGNETTWLRGSSALRHQMQMGGIGKERGQLVMKHKRECVTSTLQKASSVTHPGTLRYNFSLHKWGGIDSDLRIYLNQVSSGVILSTGLWAMRWSNLLQQTCLCKSRPGSDGSVKARGDKEVETWKTEGVRRSTRKVYLVMPTTFFIFCLFLPIGL